MLGRLCDEGAVRVNGKPAKADGYSALRLGFGSKPSKKVNKAEEGGLKTLGVRMDRHSDNAQAVAEWLLERPEVEAVLYPGLPSHPGHELVESERFRQIVIRAKLQSDDTVSLIAAGG